jgi:cell division protease FtsH
VRHYGRKSCEKVTFNRISTGALSDLEKVTKQARAMVTVYGLNENWNVTYYDSGQSEYNFSKPYSEETARVIDEEISLLMRSVPRAIQILEDNKDRIVWLIFWLKRSYL